MKSLKKLMALALALCMLVGVLPVSALAADTLSEAGHLTTKPDDGTTEGAPFIKGTGGSNSFRIPAMVTLSDGTLVAAADARWNTTYDGGGLDTIVSVSKDKGKTWNYSFANYLGDNGNEYNGTSSTCFIDPALAVTKDDTIYMLCDLYPYGVALNGNKGTAPETKVGFNSDGKLLLSNNSHGSYDYYLDGNYIYTSAGTQVSGYYVDGYFNLYYNNEYKSNLFFAGSDYKVVRTGFLYLTKSTDNGETWSEPTLLNQKTSSEMVCLVAPGRGLVTDNGMIVFPVYSYNGSQSTQKMSFIYSEDGVNWKRTANYTGDSWSSESAVVQMDENTLRFFYRNGTTYLCYVDYDLDNMSWGSQVKTDIATNSNCQISAITYSKTMDGKQVILVSCPSNQSNQSSASARLNGKMFVFTVEEDGTMKQQTSFALNSTHSSTNYFMYSCLAELNNGQIAVLYEDNESGWGTGSNYYYQMTYTSIDLSTQLTFDETKEDETPANNGVTVSGDGLTVKSAEKVTEINGLSSFVAYDVKLTKGGEAYTDSAEITIPLNGTYPAGLKLRGFVVEKNGDITYIDDVQRDDEKDTLTFTVPHFSVVGATVAPLANDGELSTLPESYQDSVGTTTTTGESYWEQVTNGVNGITSDKKYLIAYQSGNSYYLLSKTGGATSVTGSDNKITSAGTDYQFTLIGSGNTWTIKDSGDKYLYPTATYNRWWSYSLSTQQSEAQSVTISGNSTVTIGRSVSSGSSTTAYINASSNLFSVSFGAGNSGSSLYLFKQVTTEGKTVYTVSTSGIEALIGAVPTEQDLYTNETWSTFQEALAAANNAVSNTKASYETEDAAKEQLAVITAAAENLYNAWNNLEKYKTIDITINYTCDGKVVKMEKKNVVENATSVTLLGSVTADGNSYKVNSTTLTISPTTQTIYTVPVTLIEGTEVTIQVGATKEISVELTTGQYVKWTTADGHYVSVAGVYNTTSKAYGNTGVIVGNNVTETGSPALVIGTVYNANGSVASTHKWLVTVTEAAADTNKNQKYVCIDIPRIQNCTVYYSVNAGELIEITDDMLDGPYKDNNGTYYKLKVALVDEVQTGKLQYSFFAAPDEGYALTYMSSTNSASQYYVLGNGSNPDGTDSSAWPFVSSYDWTTFDGLATKPVGSNTTVWDQSNGYRWGLIQGNFTVAQLRVMFTNAIALGCDGTLVFTKNDKGTTGKDSSNGNNLITELAFVAEKLPEIQKVLTGVTHNKTYQAYKPGMTISLGDTLHYTLYVCVPQMSYAGSVSVDYTTFKLVDELTNHQWFASTLNSQTAEAGFAFGSADADLSNANNNKESKKWENLDNFSDNWTKQANEDGSVAYFLNSFFEYYNSEGKKLEYAGSDSYIYAFATSLTLSKENFLDVVKDGKIVNTADLSYYYKGQYSNGSSENASNVEVSVKVEVPEYVIDFGGAILIDMTDNTLGGTIVAVEDGLYGKAYIVGENKLLYVPNSILLDDDFVKLTITDEDNETELSGYGVRIHPASTVYYEEGFINWATGWTAEGTVTKATTFTYWTCNYKDQSQLVWNTNAGTVTVDLQQTTSALGSKDHYGYDDAYASNTGASNGTQASSKVTGASGTFTFTGTGVELYANCDTDTGYVMVTIKDANGSQVRGYMINTKIGSGSSAATSGQVGAFSSLPIMSVRDLEYGTYTVTVTKLMRDDKSVYIDGVRIYGTEEDSSVYTPDNEQNPTFEELRDHVLDAIQVGDSTQYGKLDVVDQVYNQIDGDALIVDVGNVDQSFVDNKQDLLENGPKNELYLQNGQTLVFKVSTKGLLQLGLKAPQGATDVEIYVNETKLELNKITSSVDMFYELIKETSSKETTYNVTVKNSGSKILSVTLLKVCGVSNNAQTTAFQALTAEDIRFALRVAGYAEEEEEEPLNGWVLDGDVWYYYENGTTLTGWQEINGAWYYLNESGVMQTGWQEINGVWYYLNESGVMQTGWQEINGAWYYLNESGVMQTGWQEINGVWYYLNESGVMQTGWQYIGGAWYYLNESGVMQTGWQEINGVWYYLNESGVMQTGWLLLGRHWYYLYGGGQMAVGSTLNIGGTSYTFDASGLWIG